MERFGKLFTCAASTKSVAVRFLNPTGSYAFTFPKLKRASVRAHHDIQEVRGVQFEKRGSSGSSSGPEGAEGSLALLKSCPLCESDTDEISPRSGVAQLLAAFLV